MRWIPILLVAALGGAGCGSRDSELNELTTRVVKLPDGTEIEAELKYTAQGMQAGMMFRDDLPRGRGMLFMHEKPGPYTYWMYNVKIPLDLIFMDSGRQVLEIIPDVPACQSKASTCPTYGGNPNTRYVLELGAGEARRMGIRPGMVLSF